MTARGGTIGKTPVVRVGAPVAMEAGDRAAATAREAADSVPVRRTGPTGIAAQEPLVTATREGETALFPHPGRSRIRDLVAALEAGDLPGGGEAVVEHDAEAATLPTPGVGPLSVGRRSVLGPCGWVDPLSIDDHDFVAPETTAGAATGLGLLGRGRGDAVADEPVTDAWETARAAEGEPVVVVNANETRSEQRADRTLLAGAPMPILDSLAAVAAFVGADDAVVYLNATDETLHRHLSEAVEVAADTLPVVPELVTGPDEYRAGAPTAALEALEGADRIEPRLQPPTPAEHGLYGRPTVVHTPRTLAQVQRAISDPDAFDPTAADPGTRVYTVTGDVADPATVELPPGSTLAAVRDAVDLRGSFKMACVGGVFGGITADLGVVPAASSLQAADLGTDGVVELLNTERCVLADVGERARFAASENSGRCVPGREGTKQLAELLRDVYDGSFETDTIRELGRTMARTSNCQTGASAPRPVTTAIDEFEPEFRAHTNGRCPNGTCQENL